MDRPIRIRWIKALRSGVMLAFFVSQLGCSAFPRLTGASGRGGETDVSEILDASVELKGAAVTPGFIDFPPNSLTLGQLVSTRLDQNLSKWNEGDQSWLNYDNFFVRLQRGRQLIVLPLRMAEFSDFGRLSIIDGDAISVLFDSGRLGTAAFQPLNSLPFDDSGLTPREVNRKLVDLIKALDNRELEVIRTGDDRFGWSINPTWIGALVKVKQEEDELENPEQTPTVEEIRISNEAIAMAFGSASEQYTSWKGKFYGKVGRQILGKPVTVLIDGNQLGQVEIGTNIQTVFNLTGPLQNSPDLAVVTRIIDDGENRFVENTILPIKLSRESLGMRGTEPFAHDLKYFKLKPNDVVNFFSNADLVPLIRQAKLEPKIERILRLREAKLDEGRRLFENVRNQRQRRFPVSSRLPSAVGQWVQPLESGFNNLSRNSQSFFRNITN